MAVVAKELFAQSILDPGHIFEIASEHECSEQQVLFALGHLRDLGMVEDEGVDFSVTSSGQWHLPWLIEELRSSAA